MRVAKLDALFEPTIRLCVGLSYVIGLAFGIYLVFKNQITLGDLVSFNMYLGMMIWPMFAIGELINIMQRGSASLDRVDETLSVVPDVQDVPQYGSRRFAGHHCVQGRDVPLSHLDGG